MKREGSGGGNSEADEQRRERPGSSVRRTRGQHQARAPAAERSGDTNEWFRQIAQWVSNAAGSPWASLAAFVFVVAWLGSGPFFRYSDHWQLIINTSTTIVTFLMVFLIQNAQNRDARAIHLKLDELIRVSRARATRS